MFARSALSSAKVAVLGAAGGIGQPLSLLCKLSPYVDTLSCYDVVGTPGVAADLSHCPTKSHTTGSLPDADAGAWPEGSEGGLKAALEGVSGLLIRISSITPNSIAFSLLMKVSLSMTFSISGSSLPVWWTYRPLSRLRSLRISSAWIAMSEAMPWAPPLGWWSMILVDG
ncbi:hypothetical protein TrRE_jg5530, partial [Triparma retinervis]